MSQVYRQWQCPEQEAAEKYKVGWLNEAAQEGENWQSSQRGYKDWKRGLDILSGDEGTQNLLEYRSRISGHRLKTNIRVMIAGLSNIRPMWGYHASKSMASYAQVLNRTARALYLEGFWDQSIKEVLAYAAATCTGWMRPVYMRDQMGKGRGNIKMLTYGMPCVLPVQLPSDGDWQEAYAVTLLDEMPIYMAHAKFPDFQDRLHPTSSRYWYAREIRKAARANRGKRPMSLFRKRDDGGGTDLYCPIRWTTIIDHRLNDTGGEVRMGEPGSSWEYKVPALGQDISDGFGGSRKADENDCRLYPNRRLIISSEDCVMYDGPAFNWHGQLDLIPFCLDKWPWEPMGFSAVHDGYELSKAIDDIDRGIMDKIKGLMNLPLAYNINSVNQSEAQDFDPFEPRVRIGYDGNETDKPFQMPVPPEVYRIEPEILAAREKFNEELDFQSQTRDIMELGKARALGKGMDQLEALISANGPLVKDMSRSMEAGLGRMGEQVGYLIPQYMTTARLIQYAEPETMGMDVFDYDPGSLVPSHLPDDQVHDAEQNPVPSKYSRMERSRWFAGNVKFVVMPHSVHEITQMTYRLMLLQIKQRGAPVSWATVMESCDVQNTDKPDGNTEQERYYEEKKEELVQMIRLKKAAEGMGIDPAAMGGGGGKEKGSSPKGGRPSTLATPPHLEQKGDGRPVVSTSH